MSKKMFSENAQAVIRFLQGNIGDFTAIDIADATGLNARQVNGTATGLQRKGLAERVVVEGIEKKVIRLCGEGLSINPDAEIEE